MYLAVINIIKEEYLHSKEVWLIYWNEVYLDAIAWYYKNNKNVFCLFIISYTLLLATLFIQNDESIYSLVF